MDAEELREGVRTIIAEADLSQQSGEWEAAEKILALLPHWTCVTPVTMPAELEPRLLCVEPYHGRPGGYVSGCLYDGDWQTLAGWIIGPHVTHHMPLPAPPKEAPDADA